MSFHNLNIHVGRDLKGTVGSLNLLDRHYFGQVSWEIGIIPRFDR